MNFTTFEVEGLEAGKNMIVLRQMIYNDQGHDRVVIGVAVLPEDRVPALESPVRINMGIWNHVGDDSRPTKIKVIPILEGKVISTELIAENEGQKFFRIVSKGKPVDFPV